ncbi:heparinase II/III family protein [Kordiimonas sp.]|uniref:heparinase II/III family protein n=1 Tax=Kordiimonas sp. TaxID=1970157 RepID=UPI003A9407C0
MINRLCRQFIRPPPITNAGLRIRSLCKAWTPPVPKPISILGKEEFCFLNRKETIRGAVGWNNPRLPKLWLYNLHYHDGLCSNETLNVLKEQVISRWINENPFGTGNGWEPYPLSLRIVNWVKWRLSGGSVAGLNESLFQQAHVLSRSVEYHLLGNHLFANAKALIFAGLYFEGDQSRNLLRKGLQILEQELPEQFLTDGGHFELSTTYHATLTEDLLDIINILRAYDQRVSAPLLAAASRAMAWLAVMTRPDGLPPLFNDAAYGTCPMLSDLNQYAYRLGLAVDQKTRGPLIDLPASGYFRYDGAAYSFWGDAGQIGPDYIPGHAHCDMLNFELFAYGRPVVVDTGTSTYEIGAWRLFERSTAAHNTVRLGNYEQSEMWGAFRVGRRAKIVKREVGANWLRASHNGFKRLGVIHQRSFEFGDRLVQLEDRLLGKSGVTAVARFHLHPDARVKISGNIAQAEGVAFLFSGATRIGIADYDYAPEFNKRVPAKCIEVHFDRHLTTDIQI